jgi:alkyl hydroperoxide reductase subunit F
MLDSDLVGQLRTVFADLPTQIGIVAQDSDHEKQEALLEMLRGVASASPLISFFTTPDPSVVPTFHLERDGQPTGIRFQGIPGGHEFTSLILAILNAAGRGKLPDDALSQRIRRLRGPAKIRTYISLSCENCPDIIQALNQIALAHGSLEHTMIDGGLVPDELENLKIQGVPAVFVGDTLIHSGRASLVELIAKLEAALGTSEAAPTTAHLGHFDVAVVGGGPAGGSAAIYSVRKGLKTALIAEKIGGQMQQTKGIENFTSVQYTEGPQLSASLDAHLRSYPVRILEHRRVKSISKDKVHSVLLDSGETLTCDALIIATGANWRELGVPGEKEYIGRGVAFCPHCDGPYYKDKKVAVVGGGNSGVEAAIDLSGICREVILLEFNDKLKADDVLIQKLKSLSNVAVITQARSTEVVGNGERVIGLKYQDRATNQEATLNLDGIFVQIGLSPNSSVVKDLVEINRYGEIVVDAKGRTSVPGIYAAGDVTTVPFKQIVIASGEGAKVALTAFEDRIRGHNA